MLVLAAVGVVAFNTLLKTIFGPTPLQIERARQLLRGQLPQRPRRLHHLAVRPDGLVRARQRQPPDLPGDAAADPRHGPLRILDGAHWPSDVLAGYALGLAWTIVVLVIGLPWAAGQREMEDHPARQDTKAGIYGSS